MQAEPHDFFELKRAVPGKQSLCRNGGIIERLAAAALFANVKSERRPRGASQAAEKLVRAGRPGIYPRHNANRISVGFSPCGVLFGRFIQNLAFFRSLQKPALILRNLRHGRSRALSKPLLRSTPQSPCFFSRQ